MQWFLSVLSSVIIVIIVIEYLAEVAIPNACSGSWLKQTMWSQPSSPLLSLSCHPNHNYDMPVHWPLLRWIIFFVPLCVKGFSSSNPHVDVARGGAVKVEDIICGLMSSFKILKTRKYHCPLFSKANFFLSEMKYYIKEVSLHFNLL